VLVVKHLLALVACSLVLMACSSGGTDTPSTTSESTSDTSDSEESVEGDALESDGDTSAEDESVEGSDNDSLAGDLGPSETENTNEESDAAETDAVEVDDALPSGPEEPVEPVEPEELPWLDDPVWQCENGVPISVVVDVVLEANTAGCPWNEGDNLNPIQAAFAAYQYTSAQAALPGPAQAICAVNLDSASFDPNYEQPFTYDDHFMLLFNDIVLLSSYGDLVAAMPSERNFVLFDWASIAGSAMNFNNNSAYCLGYGGDDPVVCTIPAPESNSPVAYSVGGSLNNAISSVAVQEQRVEFAVVTFGDNDPESDCRNSELRMQLVVDYVIAP